MSDGLPKVNVAVQPMDEYFQCEFCSQAQLDRIHKLAAPLTGLRVAYVNATAYGGGVSELLRSFIPLLRGLGIDAEWNVIVGGRSFYETTKGLHNALQGAGLGPKFDWDVYLEVNEQNAMHLGSEYDVVVINDPQPAAMIDFAATRKARWVWRCHIDTSEPNAEAWAMIKPYVERYDATVFSVDQFVPPGLERTVHVIPPGIDPLSAKNMEIDRVDADRIVRWMGLDDKRPIMTQVSRFDPWKDPDGVIDAYRLAREAVPDLQLALVGSMALDDPEGWRIHSRITARSKDDPDIHILTNLSGVGNIEVNAFQRASDVIVQKSIREGFGLVVSEALWKGTPVVAGNVGGIPLQVTDGESGFLVDTVDECARRVVDLVQNPDLGLRLGAAGHDHIRDGFLITRVVEDELKMLASVVANAKV